MDDEEEGEGKPLLRRLDSDPAFPAWRKLGYAIGSVPRASFATIISFYLTPFLLEVAQLAPIYSSLILFFGKLLTAISDPATGYLVSRTPETRLGKHRVWLVAAIPCAALTYFFLWFVPDTSLTWKIVYFLIVYFLYAVSITCFYLPFTAMVMCMSNSQRERDSIVAYRIVFEIGGTVFGQIIQGVFFFVGGEGMWPQERAYFLSALVLVLLFLCLGCMSVACSVERYHLSGDEEDSVLRNYLDIARFKPFQIFAACQLCMTVGYGVLINSYALYFKHVLDAYVAFPLCIVLIYLTAALSIPFWQRAMKRFGKKTTLGATLPFAMLVLWAHFFVRYHLAVVLSLSIVGGIVIGCLQLVPNSMIPDVIAMFGLEKGVGKEPLFYSLTGFLDTFGNSVCQASTTLALQFSGYVTGAAKQPHSVATALRIIVGGFPTLMMALALIFLGEYPITEASRRLMRQRIKKSMVALPQLVPA